MRAHSTASRIIDSQEVTFSVIHTARCDGSIRRSSQIGISELGGYWNFERPLNRTASYTESSGWDSRWLRARPMGFQESFPWTKCAKLSSLVRELLWRRAGSIAPSSRLTATEFTRNRTQSASVNPLQRPLIQGPASWFSESMNAAFVAAQATATAQAAARTRVPAPACDQPADASESHGSRNGAVGR